MALSISFYFDMEKPAWLVDYVIVCYRNHIRLILYISAPLSRVRYFVARMRRLASVPRSRYFFSAAIVSEYFFNSSQLGKRFWGALEGWPVEGCREL